MRMDFHYHTLLWKKCPFYKDWFEKGINQAKKRGMTAIAITDHYNAKYFEDIYRSLDEMYDYNGEYYTVKGIKIFCGVELSIKERAHIIAIGKRDDVLDLRRDLYDEGLPKSRPTLMRVVNEIESRNMLGIWAHPIRHGNPLHKIDIGVAKRLEFMDFNGKDVNKAKEMLEFETENALIAVAGSDTHHPIQAGIVKTYINHECESIEDLKECLRQRQFHIEVENLAQIKCKMARRLKHIYKRKLKRRIEKDEFSRE